MADERKLNGSPYINKKYYYYYRMHAGCFCICQSAIHPTSGVLANTVHPFALIHTLFRP